MPFYSYLCSFINTLKNKYYFCFLYLLGLHSESKKHIYINDYLWYVNQAFLQCFLTLCIISVRLYNFIFRYKHEMALYYTLVVLHSHIYM